MSEHLLISNLTVAPPAVSKTTLTGPILWHIATAMIEVEKSRGGHRRGKEDVAVSKPIAKVRILEGALIIVLFSMHSMYRKRLQACRVKGTASNPDFQKLMQSLVVEWAGECHGILLYDEKPRLTFKGRCADSNLLVGILSMAFPTKSLINVKHRRQYLFRE